jgi:hypothetical protein
MAKYGKARCKMALVQEEFGNRLNDGYIGNLGTWKLKLQILGYRM